MPVTLLELDGVEKQYRQRKGAPLPVLRGVDLAISRGGFYAIMGPSGCGKSTLLQIMGGLDRPSAGRVSFGGLDLGKASARQLDRLRGESIGFIFQNFNLVPGMPVWENVLLPTIFHNGPRQSRAERARELLEQVGLGHRLRHRPEELSGGERQRVAIARALVNDPLLILADEPTGNLDSASSAEVTHLLVALAGQGKTVVLVTHDREVAGRADQILYMRDGRIEGGGV